MGRQRRTHKLKEQVTFLEEYPKVVIQEEPNFTEPVQYSANNPYASNGVASKDPYNVQQMTQQCKKTVDYKPLSEYNYTYNPYDIIKYDYQHLTDLIASPNALFVNWGQVVFISANYGILHNITLILNSMYITTELLTIALVNAYNKNHNEITNYILQYLSHRYASSILNC